MKTKSTQFKIRCRWFNMLIVNLKKRVIEYHSLKTKRKNRMRILKLDDHLLRDIGFGNFIHEKRCSKKK
ncbi:MAG: hypothetical protein MJE63_27610 [Proteobacteria bacterium]|nr:hypothetical protein [Pseudomonadota bacterium]